MQAVQDWITKLTWVDFVVVVAVLRGCFVGYRTGFVSELLRCVSYVLTAVVLFQFRKFLSNFLTVNTVLNVSAATVVADLILVVGVFVIAKIFIWSFSRILKNVDDNFILRTGGMLLGVGRWLVIMSFLLLVVSKLPLQSLKDDIARSATGKNVAVIAPTFFDFLSKLSPQLGLPNKQ